MVGLTRLVAVILVVTPCLGACAGADDDALSSPSAPGAAEPVAAEGFPVSAGRTASALGIETKGGVFTPLIPRDTPLPATHRETFTTAEDDQSKIEIDVLHGTTDRAADARPVGHYVLQPKPAAKGVPQIEVTFAISPSGAVSLTATDSATSTPVPVSRTS